MVSDHFCFGQFCSSLSDEVFRGTVGKLVIPNHDIELSVFEILGSFFDGPGSNTSNRGVLMLIASEMLRR